MASPLEVVIFMGLQGAGKSSFYRARFTGTHDHISKDNFRNNRKPSRRQLQLLTEALTVGRSVVVDNTNPTRADREAIIELARAHGARVIGYFFESKIADCLQRNAEREGVNRVPDIALYTTAKKLELPSSGEGFEALYFVRLADEGKFEVSAWNEETEEV